MGGIILPILNGSPGLISVLRTGQSCPDPPRDWDQETQVLGLKQGPGARMMIMALRLGCQNVA